MNGPKRWRGAPRLLTLFLLLSALTACALAPGGHIGYDADAEPLHDAIDVQPITLDLVQRLNAVVRDLPPAADSAAAEEDYDYLIGRGDILNVIVYDHPELTIPAGSERSAAESGNVVHSDGTIFYPYIGPVHVAGRSVRSVRDEIQERLASYIAKPQVEVRVASFASQKVYVTGQVSQPGTFPITNVPMRVLDAIGHAGGPTELANWHEVILTRNGRDKRLSLYSMLMSGSLGDNLLLQDGDILHVTDVANHQVYVLGEVIDPAALSMGNTPLSLTTALARVGGMNEATANAKGIFVIRRNRADEETFATVYQLNARNAAAFVLGSEFQLQPRDVVYVTTAPVARWNRVLAQLLPSLTTVFQATEIGENVDNVRGD